MLFNRLKERGRDAIQLPDVGPKSYKKPPKEGRLVPGSPALQARAHPREQGLVLRLELLLRVVRALSGLAAGPAREQKKYTPGRSACRGEGAGGRVGLPAPTANSGPPSLPTVRLPQIDKTPSLCFQAGHAQLAQGQGRPQPHNREEVGPGRVLPVPGTDPLQPQAQKSERIRKGQRQHCRGVCGRVLAGSFAGLDDHKGATVYFRG
jgi:hypothetical protein